MVTPYNSSPQPAIPKTSGALVFQIFNPVNYAEGAPPAAAPSSAPADMFQRTNAASPSNASGEQSATPGVSQPNPFANPQQQLTDAYNQAMNARNSAEQARNSYLNLANQLNSQAFQNQSQPQNPGFPGLPQQPGIDPAQQWQQQQAQQAQQQYMQQLQAMQQQQQQQALMQQQAQQQAMMQQQQQQALAQQQAMQQQQPMPPEQQMQQPPQPQGLENVSLEELNRMISQPQTLQEKVDAMEEIGVRGQGTVETIELLKQEALADTSMLPPGQAQDDGNYVRQAALWTLGMLNKSQNSNTPIDKVPGLSVIEQIISSKNENSDVKQAAIQALQVMDRLGERRIKKALKKATRDKNGDVSRLAQEALAGTSIPLPTSPGAGGGVGMTPGPGGMQGLDPALMQALMGGGK